MILVLFGIIGGHDEVAVVLAWLEVLLPPHGEARAPM
jgi:hypothetical protein